MRRKTAKQQAAARRRTTRKAIVSLLALLVGWTPLSVQASLLADSVSSFKIAADLSRRAAQEAAVRQAAAILTTVIASTPDTDGDPFPEPPPFVIGAGPAGGGLLPTGVGAPLSDGYGGMLGYCAWDNGAVVGGGNRLAGSASDTGAPAFAVVSAGLDGVFNRSCAQIAAGTNNLNDDYVVAMSTAQIRQGVGGTVYFGDPVADMTALGALTGASQKDGELRLVKADNTLWRWNPAGAGTWTSVGSATTFSNISVTGGSVNGTVIGNNTPASGAFTTLSGALTGNVTGNLTGNVTGNLTGNVTGNAATATRLLSPASIGITGDATWSVTFDGSANVSGTLALSPTGVSSGTYGSAISTGVFTVDAAGRLVAAGNALITPDWTAISGKPTTLAGYGITGIDGIPIGATTPASGRFTTLAASGALTVGGSVTAPSFIGSGAALTSLNADNIGSGTLAVARGGTGLGTVPANGQLLIGNGSGYVLAGLTGTINQIIVTPGSGSITLSLPQDIAATSTPTFGGLTLTGALTGTTATFTNVKTGDGTVGAPGYAFSGDPTTGLYRPATAQLAASVAGTGGLWITAGSTAVGFGALASDSAASNYNTAVGSGALGSNTTGAYNVAIGSGGLQLNTTGSTNTAVGNSALKANTTGFDNVATGTNALIVNTVGDHNSANGSNSLQANIGGSYNVAGGAYALFSNTSGSYNVASGAYALYWNNAVNNTAMGYASLVKNTTGTNNTALGYSAANTVTNYVSGSNSTFIGANASIADTAQMASASNITLLGAGASASGLGSSNVDAHMTAIGAGASITTPNTVVLGRASLYASGLPTGDKTIIGAAGDSGAAAVLQINGASQHIGLASAPTGTAGMLYYNSVANQFQYYNGTAWNNFGAGGGTSLSALTSASAANTLNNAAYAQNWNWQLTTDSSAFSIGETAASTGGSGTQYLMNIGTLTGSTAIPLRVSTRGVEAFRVDSANPQIVANVGSAAAPSFSFNGSQGTGYYAPAVNTLGASLNGTRSMWITNGSVGLGFGTLVSDTSNNSTALGTQAMAANAGGSQNVGVGYQALAQNTAGNDNTAVGYRALAVAVTNRENSAFGSGALGKAIGNSSTAIGFHALTNTTTGDENVAVGAFSMENNVDGRSNLAVGTYSLSRNVNGSLNTALGAGALYANQSGSDNVSVGGDSMNSNTTGARNVAMGTHALRGNLGGDENVAIGNSSMLNNLTGSSNVSIGSQALFSNTASDNTAVGFAALRANVSGTANTAMGRGALYSATSDNNSAFGYYALVQNSTGTLNVAMGHQALSGNTLGSSNVAIGSSAGRADSIGNGTFANTIGSNNTFIGASAIPGTTSRLDYATVIGSDAIVTTSKSVVLGRASVYASGLPTGDKTIIGAAGDSGAAAVLQINGASQHIGLASAPTGTAGMLYYNSVANQFQYYNGTAWNNFGAGGGTSLSALTSASAANTLNNAAYAQNWNWQLAGNTSAFSIGETAASTGGSGTQYLMNIGTLAGSTAIPLRVSVRGVEAFRVDSINPQLVANNGTLAAPSYAFTGQQSTGFYLPATGQLGASVAGTRSLWLTAGSASLGEGALLNDTSPNATAIGTNAMAANTSGIENSAFGFNALTSNTTGVKNTAAGFESLKFNTTGNENAAFGRQALLNNTTGNSNVGAGPNALLFNTIGNNNIAVGGGSLFSNVSGSSNVAVGNAALFFNAASDNVAMGDGTLFSNSSGAENVALGGNALRANTTGNGNVAVGRFAGFQDAGNGTTNANVGGNYNTFLGNRAMTGTTATINYATALGAAALVSSSNTVVLGRTSDVTVIGATADDLSGYKLQVTGGIKALTGGLSVAGGDLVLGSGTVSGLLSARPLSGVANRIYVSTDTNEIYRDTGSAWNRIAAGAAGGTLASADFANQGTATTVLHGNAAGNPSWSAVNLTSDVSGVLPVASGGTGLGTTPTNGQLLIGNGAGYTLAGLTGTTNQITVTPGSGSITLALPQNIATTSTPTFGGLTLNGALTGTTATLTGGLSVAGGDLVLGSGTVSGLLSARPLFGVANRVYVSTDTNEIYRDTGSAWNRIAAGAAGGTLASVDFANQGTTTTVLHGNAAGNPSWSAVSLTSDVSGVLPITSGGTGTSTVPAANRVLMMNGAGSYVPTSFGFTNGTVSISSTGSSGSITFINPQQLAPANSPTFTNLNLTGVLRTASGTASTPSHTFSADLTTGLYLPAAGQLGASVAATRSMWITAGSVGLGSGALASDSSPSINFNVAVGVNALNANTSGVNNVATGYTALRNNSTGSFNVASGNQAGLTTTNPITGSNLTFIGSNATIADTAQMASASGITLLGAAATASGLGSSSLDARITAIGAGASVTSINTVVLGRAADSTVIGATADDLSGYKLQVTGGIKAVSGGLNLAAGTTAVAPLRFNSGTNLTTPVAGAMEFNGTNLFMTITGPARKTIAYTDSAMTGDGSGITNLNAGNIATGTLTVARGGTGLGTTPTNGQLLIGNGSGYTLASLTGTANQIIVTPGSGSITLALPQNIATTSTPTFGGLTLNGALTGTTATLTGGLSVAGGDLVLNSPTIIGLLSARPVAGTAGRIYLATDTNQLYRDDGTSWNALSAGNVALSSVTAATANNTINNAANAQSWNWQLAANSTAFNIGENVASAGGTGTQYLMNVGTLAASTAIPFRVATRGTEALRVDSVNPQIVANNGTVAAPTYSFAGQQTTGFYLPAAFQLAASVAGSRSLWISSTNVGLGPSALLTATIGIYNVAVGRAAMATTTSGSQNTAVGDAALSVNTTGNYNVASGANALLKNTTGSSNTALGTSAGNTAFQFITGSGLTFVGFSATIADTAQMASASNVTLLGAGATASGITGANNQDVHMTAIGAGASVTSINTVVLGRAADSVVVGGTAAGGELFHVYGTAGGTSGFATSSDIRYKTNITPVINALETIGNLKGVHYEFNQAAFPQHGFESGRQLGFIAQQIEPFVPEVVRTDRFGFKSVQYSQLVPLLAEGINAQQLILKHLSLKDPATLLVDIKTFQGNDAVFENIKATGIKVALLEAETAKIKKLEADSIESKLVRSDVVKSGEIEVFVSMGSFQPIFVPLANAQYIVNAIADDGSSAFASVAFMGGRITVTPISGKGVDVTAMGAQVGLVAASKKVKATWIRMS